MDGFEAVDGRLQKVRAVGLHVFRLGEDPSSCEACSLKPDHSLHFHEFRAGYTKALCLCGYPSDADCHILVVEDNDEARDRSLRESAELANRVHDSDVILRFKTWIQSQSRSSIAIDELSKVLDIYALTIRRGTPK